MAPNVTDKITNSNIPSLIKVKSGNDTTPVNLDQTALNNQQKYAISPEIIIAPEQTIPDDQFEEDKTRVD